MPILIESGEEVVLACLAAEFEPSVPMHDQTELAAAVCASIFPFRHCALLQQFSGQRRTR